MSGGVFEGMVSRYSPDSKDSGTSSQQQDEETVVSDLQHVLSGFVETNPRAWAPLISKWSLDTLGDLFSWAGFYEWAFQLFPEHTQ